MVNRKILLFGGTAEAREVAKALMEYGIDFTLSVATDFGKEMAQAVPNVFSGRLGREEIEKLLPDYDMVIDATHPYAAVATKNIKEACANANTEYIRVLRPPSQDGGAKRALYFSDNHAAIEYLNTTEGNILLTTGSKDAADFVAIKNFAQRVFIRMLPLADALQKCLALGYKNSHLICLQGKFSKEFNIEIIKMINAKYLMTKESGEPGGFANKLKAAYETGAEVIVISRPVEEEGLTLAQVMVFLENAGKGRLLN